MATATTRIRSSASSSDEFSTPADTHNVGKAERWVSVVGGGALAGFGVARGGFSGLAMALAGGGLLHRGATGKCMTYSALGINTARANDGRPVTIGAGRGVKVTQSITVLKEPAELFRFWRSFSNLPRVMRHLKSVELTGDNQSHWTASAPFGKTVEWNAEIYTERADELIGWRSLAGSQVDTAGSVRFRRMPADGGTHLTVTLKYDPPAGKLGAVIAAVFRRSAGRQVREDLRRFKQFMETGEARSGPLPAPQRVCLNG
jgi:uncharacterized membrane protein